MATNPASRKVKNVTDTNKPEPAAPSEPTPTDAPAPTPPLPSRHASDPEAAQNEADDVQALLSRHTFDGKGENAVPPANFRGFATEGVEKGNLKPVADVVQDVLNGNFGTTAQVVVERLRAAGYTNLDEIEAEYNKRVAAGAPKAF